MTGGRQPPIRSEFTGQAAMFPRLTLVLQQKQAARRESCDRWLLPISLQDMVSPLMFMSAFFPLI